ncbi:MAG TPA: TolC family protein, partial [Planctomycetaceae bacterium]|nr:TolC family protein [Planctomycetaceae bacterium]
GLAQGDTLTEDAAAFTSPLAKTMADGGQFAVSHNWNYSSNNAPARLFPSVYTGFLRAEYRRPLWAASGLDFTRINGPIGQSLTGVTGVSQGVVIARINTDISIADFELTVAGLVKEIEDAYWDLALAYRTYDAEMVALTSALRTLRETEAKLITGFVSASDEAQARDNYFDTRSRTENALADLYALEARLRRLLSLPVNDGHVIRPVDEPAVAEFQPDWRISLAQALTNRPELRRQKWSIKSLELQLQAARSLAQPRLDFISGYQVNAFGDHLLGQNDNDAAGTAQGLNSAYETLTQGNQTSWDLGLQFSMPFGFRLALAQIRNVELRLAKARAALNAQELEISHELAAAFQQLDRFYLTAQTNFNRRRAAAERVAAAEAEYELERITLDIVLRAQISLSQAEIAYYRSLIEYNKSVAELYYRMGRLLELNEIELAENAWTPQAYIDALRRAWERTNAIPAPHLKTRPLEFEADLDAHPGELLLPDARDVFEEPAPAPESPPFVPPPPNGDLRDAGQVSLPADPS